MKESDYNYHSIFEKHIPLLNTFNQKTNGIKYLQIVDLDGKKEITLPKNQNSPPIEINIQQLPAGMYILKAVTTDVVESNKFIVTK